MSGVGHVRIADEDWFFALDKAVEGDEEARILSYGLLHVLHIVPEMLLNLRPAPLAGLEGSFVEVLDGAGRPHDAIFLAVPEAQEVTGLVDRYGAGPPYQIPSGAEPGQGDEGPTFPANTEDPLAPNR
jgi:hypothetical protein